jgi:site-specific DNA-methyltransferase (adenine-specific)
VSTARYLIGDVFDRLAGLPDDSVDLVLTSPPFLALRSYLPDDHPDKAKEIGQEPTPAEFLDTLLALTAEWGRVLAPHGSIAVELGDSYSGSSASGTDQKGSSRYPNGRGMESLAIQKKGDGWPLDKSLCVIPELYAACLSYGRNLLTGDESPAGQWRVRNMVRWVRPNPPVGALGDKYRPATSVIVIATRSRNRWFDLDAVRTPHKSDPATTTGNGYTKSDPAGAGETVPMPSNHAGAPPLDWWEVSPEAYKGSHYATWPRKLLTRPIESMCPSEVCRTCGEPRRRIVKPSEWPDDGRVRSNTRMADYGGKRHGNRCAEISPAIWTDCGHDDYRPGVVLDPFAGSGTTLAVATGLGRDAIGIDIDKRNADLAAERVGMFLEVES